MAVTKLWSVTERLGQVIDYATNPEKTSANIKREFSPEQYQALADVIAYAKDEEKTEREFYVEGINCNVAIARDQLRKQIYLLRWHRKSEWNLQMKCGGKDFRLL